MYLDIAVAKLIEADHSNNINEKNDLLSNLKKYSHKSTILQTFIYLDNINGKNQYKNFEEYISTNNNSDISMNIKKLTDDLSKYDLDKGLNRNSVYLLENGIFTPQLPSHYKFDRAILSTLNINPLSLNKDNLITPLYSNTIRIFYNIAVINFKPTNQQLSSLIDMKIEKFLVNDCYYENIFDRNILNLKVFRKNNNDSA